MTEPAARSPIAITVSVWRALLLREALSRLFGRRAAWFWLLLEPLFHIAYVMFLFAVVKVRHVGGFETPMWIMTGLLAYFMFQRTARQALSALRANRALFSYRQVRPVDTVVARAILEGLLMLVVTVVIAAAAGLMGFHSWPNDPLRVVVAFAGMWACGLGFGMLSSVVVELSAELGRILSMATRPLYLLSGVIFPLASLPPAYRDLLMLNPLAHGPEMTRLGFAEYYHPIPSASVGYLLVWALGLLITGTAVHIVFARRIAAQ